MSKFIPQPQNTIRKHALTNGGGGNTFTIAMKALRARLRNLHKKDGERFTCKWNYVDEKLTLSVFFEDGSKKESTDPLTKDGSDKTMSDTLLKGIQKKLIDCKHIHFMFLECSFKSLEITKHEVYYVNSKNEQKIYGK